jgi:hypothetical protein
MMRLRSSMLVVLLLLTCLYAQAQSYFEGEIIYRSESVLRNVKSNDAMTTPQPASFIKASYKNGNWILQPDDGIVEYMFFHRLANKIYWKLRNVDTLFFEDGRFRRPAENDPALQTTSQLRRDTILGKVCNSFSIKTKALRITLLYNASLRINPSWYTNSKIGFYDLIYAKTKAIFLKSIVETKESVSSTTATEIYETDVDDNVFPDVLSLPLKRL